MSRCLLFLLFSCRLFAAIGDNAPSIPAGFVVTHPRLGAPDSAYLTAIWTNRAGTAARIFDAANAWDSTNVTTGSLLIPNLRYLALAYLAAKQAGDSSATTYLNKIKALANLNGGWSRLYLNAADGVFAGTNCGSDSLGSATDCTLTSNSTNFATACAGATCNNAYAGVNGFSYHIGTISSGGGFTNNIAALHQSQPPQVGSGMSFSVISDFPGIWGPSWLAILYDWIYNDLDTTTRASFQSTLKSYCFQFETNYTASQPSPFSDVFYTRIQQIDIIMALAQYEPGDAVSLQHLRFAMDVWVNILIPAWKQVWGGGYCLAENDAGIATSGNAAMPGCGGGWHEGWTDYVNPPSNVGQTQVYLPSLLAWANATGNMPGFFTADNGWIKNYAYFMMYKARPDFQEEQNGSVARGTFNSEYSVGTNGPAQLGSLEGLAQIYNDATLRSWARAVNRGFCSGSPCVPDGNEPSAYPYLAPDVPANSVAGGANPRVNLSKTRDFPGWGKLYMRTGWGEEDTMCSISYGGNYWSHPEMDIGNFNCFSRGALLLGYPGTYRAASNSDQVKHYKSAAIGHNLPLLYDANDRYPSETGSVGRSNGSTSQQAFANDGGQRRVGSGFSNLGGTTMQQATQGPADLAQWQRGHEYYHMGKLAGYQVGSGSKYTYAAVDITAAYNNHWSAVPNTGAWLYNMANTSNRSHRAQKVVRHFLFIPRKNGATGNSTAAYLVVYDQIIAANSSLMKKDVVHFINQPSITGASFSFQRSELATQWPFNFARNWAALLTHCPAGDCTSGNQYQYNGQGYGWMTLPAGGSITSIGGPGREFEVTDSAGTVNHNECLRGQCTSLSGSLVGMAVEPFNITGSNNTLVISIDGGTNQTITLTQGAARTATQVVADINAQLTGGVASVEGQDPAAQANTQGRVAIKSNSTGGASSIVTLQTATAYTVLGMTSFLGSNTGGLEEGLDANGVADMIHPISATSPHEVGSYRIEESVCIPNSTVTACTSGANNVEDWFLNVFLLTSVGDTNTVSTAPATSTVTAGAGVCPAGGPDCWQTAWQDNGNTCTYTFTCPKRGVGGTLTVQGAGCTTVMN